MNTFEKQLKGQGEAMQNKYDAEQDEVDDYAPDSMFDYDDPVEDETAEGLGVGDITIEDVDSDY